MDDGARSSRFCLRAAGDVVGVIVELDAAAGDLFAALGTVQPEEHRVAVFAVYPAAGHQLPWYSYQGLCAGSALEALLVDLAYFRDLHDSAAFNRLMAHFARAQVPLRLDFDVVVGAGPRRTTSDSVCNFALV